MDDKCSTFVKGFHDDDMYNRMEYRTLGKTGLKVSKISLGCGTLSDLYGEINLLEAIKTVQKALRSGINYIDTAPFYGQGRSEQILGATLKDVPREAFYIATKVGRYEKNYNNMFDFSAKKTRASVERSLQLLGLDYIDVIQIHDIEFAENLDIIIKECLPELEKIVKEGKAKYIGLTGYPLNRLKECVSQARGRFDVVLSYARHTLMDNSLYSYIPFFQQQNLGIVCAAGHALGLLTNNGPQSWHPATIQQKIVSRKAAAICVEANVELGKLAMFHFTQLNSVSTFLVGMQSCKLLEMNLSVVHNGLSKREQEVLHHLCETVFTNPMNWEGVEIKTYRSTIDK